MSILNKDGTLKTDRNVIIKNVRNAYIHDSISVFFETICFCTIFCVILYGMIFENIGLLGLVGLLIMGIPGFIFLKNSLKILNIIINPLSSDLFKNFGSVENVQKIVKEINKTTEYTCKNLIIAKNYIADTRSYDKIMKCKDILGIHKLVHRTNLTIDYYALVITDKFKNEGSYKFYKDEEQLIDELMQILKDYCPNAYLGYTQAQREHIDNNSTDFTKEEDGEEEFTCDNCGAVVQEDAEECPNCGCSFVDDVEEDEKEKEPEKTKPTKSKSSMDQKYSDLNKLKKLLDKNIITKEEFEKEKKKILK